MADLDLNRGLYDQDQNTSKNMSLRPRSKKLSRLGSVWNTAALLVRGNNELQCHSTSDS